MTWGDERIWLQDQIIADQLTIVSLEWILCTTSLLSQLYQQITWVGGATWLLVSPIQLKRCCCPQENISGGRRVALVKFLQVNNNLLQKIRECDMAQVEPREESERNGKHFRTFSIIFNFWHLPQYSHTRWFIDLATIYPTTLLPCYVRKYICLPALPWLTLKKYISKGNDISNLRKLCTRVTQQ